MLAPEEEEEAWASRHGHVPLAELWLRHHVLPKDVRRALAGEEDGEAGAPARKHVLSGAELLEALEGQAEDLDAHVVLYGRMEAEEAVRRFAEGLRIRGCLIVAAVPGASLAFPPKLVVDGPLWVARRSGLAAVSFGEGLCVGANVTIRSCYGLTHLPEGLSVNGDMHLKGCTSLASLPEDMSITGGIRLPSCRALTRIPDNLRVGGNLDLASCEGLKATYGEDMEAFLRHMQEVIGTDGGLGLGGWKELKELPKGFTVGADLCLRNCTALTGLPEELSVGGYLDIKGTKISSLPDDLKVRGDLRLAMCSELTSLPASVKPGGDLVMTNCVSLTALPEALEITGDVVLQGCAALANLPEGLQVSGSLNASDCPALTSLPANLHVGKDLELQHCTALASLPEDLHISGTLHIWNCTALTSLPAGLRTGSSVSAPGCTALTTVSADIQVGGDLVLPGCASLVSLPDGLCVGGSLDLTLCLRLSDLPEGLRFGGTLKLNGCTALQDAHAEEFETFLLQLQRTVMEQGAAGLDLTGWSALTALPSGFDGIKALELDHCHALTALPAGLHVTGNLHMRHCRALTTLPDNLRVGGLLALSHCMALTGLPRGLHVGALNVDNCSRLLSLPDDMRIDGSLSLHNCTALTALPAGLRVGESLNLGGCVALTSLPEDLYVGGTLILDDCRSLESLPASILEWPVCDDGAPHEIMLTGSGLSRETLQWLREMDTPGLRFVVALRWGRTSSHASRRPAFASATEAAAFWAKEAGREGEVQAALEGESVLANDVTLVHFLARLRDAKEFGILETRKALALRVFAVIELLASDKHAREELLARMADSLDACGDKPVWALNQMHLVVEVAKARGDAEALRALGKRVMRLMVVHDHAKRKVDSLEWVDDVCVYLRFEIDLREVLDLPVAATAMIFPSYIKIEDEELQAAKEDALAITEGQFEAWLAEWPEWQRQERHEVAARINWKELPEIKQRQSLRKRVSRRLSQLVGLTGEKMADPVSLDGAKSVWSLGELLQHWERTGLDFHNSAISVEDIEHDLRRCVSSSTITL